MPDMIHIESLELSARIGVPEIERDRAQRLTVTLGLVTRNDFSDLGDVIERAVDYSAVCTAVQAISSSRPRCLLETLGAEIASELLSAFPLRAVEVELRKYILPDTAFVAVKLRRECSVR